MRNFKWNIWTVLLAVVVVIFGIRILAAVFSWLWILGSVVFTILLWAAGVLLLVWLIRFLYNKITGR